MTGQDAAFAIASTSILADAGSPVTAPRMRLAGRRVHDAAAIPRSTSGTIAFAAGWPIATCENVAPVRSNAMPA